MKKKIIILVSTIILMVSFFIATVTRNIKNVIQVKMGDNYYIEKLATGGIEIIKFDSQDVESRILFSNTYFSKIDANSKDIVAIDIDGHLYYWNDIVKNIDSEVTYPLKNVKVKDVSIGDNHAVAVSNDGKIYVWGNNEYNQLGLGDDSIIVEAKNPACLNMPNDRFYKVSCGALSTLALTENGDVYEWGYLEKAISDFEVESTQIAIPTKINIDSPIVEVKNGFLFSLLLTNDGKVLGRGRNEFGQCLPNNDAIFVNEYTMIDLKENINKISAGSDHAMALSNAGNLYSWGKNEVGQLGTKKVEHNTVNLLELDGNIFDIFLSNNSSIIIIGKQRYCSGEFNYKLLENLYEKKYIGLSVIEKNSDYEIGDIIKISSGYATSACIDSLNNLYTWGTYLDGALGKKKAIDVDRPGLIEKLKDVCVDVESILGITTILTKDGEIYNFGGNQGCRLGIGNSLNQWEPVKVELDCKITRFFMGVSATIVNTEVGEWYAWGNNQYGSLLTGDTRNYTKPVKINIPFDVKKISSYLTHTLILDKNGKVYQYGSIDGMTKMKLNFQPVFFDEEIIDIATGPEACFAVSKMGNVYAWGNNILGYLGLTEKKLYTIPQKINFKEKIRKINISPMFCQVVALSNMGYVYTWGFDSMKISNKQFLELPVMVELPEKICDIVVGDVTVYAIADHGNVFTWGGVINNIDKKPQREPVLYSF